MSTSAIGRLLSRKFNKYARDLFRIGWVTTDTTHTKLTPSRSGVVRSLHTTILCSDHNDGHGNPLRATAPPPSTWPRSQHLPG